MYNNAVLLTSYLTCTADELDGRSTGLFCTGCLLDECNGNVPYCCIRLCLVPEGLSLCNDWLYFIDVSLETVRLDAPLGGGVGRCVDGLGFTG